MKKLLMTLSVLTCFLGGDAFALDQLNWGEPAALFIQGTASIEGEEEVNSHTLLGATGTCTIVYRLAIGNIRHTRTLDFSTVLAPDYTNYAGEGQYFSDPENAEVTFTDGESIGDLPAPGTEEGHIDGGVVCAIMKRIDGELFYAVTSKSFSISEEDIEWENFSSSIATPRFGVIPIEMEHVELAPGTIFDVFSEAALAAAPYVMRTAEPVGARKGSSSGSQLSSQLSRW